MFSLFFNGVRMIYKVLEISDMIHEQLLARKWKETETETKLQTEKYLWRREGSQQARDISHHRRLGSGFECWQLE